MAAPTRKGFEAFYKMSKGIDKAFNATMNNGAADWFGRVYRKCE